MQRLPVVLVENCDDGYAVVAMLSNRKWRQGGIRTRLQADEVSDNLVRQLARAWEKGNDVIAVLDLWEQDES